MLWFFCLVTIDSMPWHFSLLVGDASKVGVLILRSNGYHGAFGKPESKLEFPKLQIIYVSLNNFAGKLLYEYFQSWTSMKVANLTFEKDNVYMVAHMRTTSRDFTWSSDFSYFLEITNKGIKTLYEKIQNHLLAIDLSCNWFNSSCQLDYQY